MCDARLASAMMHEPEVPAGGAKQWSGMAQQAGKASSERKRNWI